MSSARILRAVSQKCDYESDRNASKLCAAKIVAQLSETLKPPKHTMKKSHKKQNDCNSEVTRHRIETVQYSDTYGE